MFAVAVRRIRRPQCVRLSLVQGKGNPKRIQEESMYCKGTVPISPSFLRIHSLCTEVIILKWLEYHYAFHLTVRLFRLWSADFGRFVRITVIFLEWWTVNIRNINDILLALYVLNTNIHKDEHLHVIQCLSYLVLTLFVCGYVMTLLVARLYNVEYMDDRWMMFWKGFG
jgi:hypothetical protein